MKIKLSFNPNNSAVQHLFIIGGTALKFWLLFKNGHLTNQYFNEGVLSLADSIYFLGQKNGAAYSTPKEFELLIERNFRVGRDIHRHDLQKFISEYWDYFSPRIRKRLCYQYETENGKTKTRVVRKNVGE